MLLAFLVTEYLCATFRGLQKTSQVGTCEPYFWPMMPIFGFNL